MDIKPILRVAPTIQSLALAGHSLGLAKKRKKRTSDFVSTASGTIVGAALIKAESDFIEGF